jgi:hypothetical protein
VAAKSRSHRTGWSHRTKEALDPHEVRTAWAAPWRQRRYKPHLTQSLGISDHHRSSQPRTPIIKRHIIIKHIKHIKRIMCIYIYLIYIYISICDMYLVYTYIYICTSWISTTGAWRLNDWLNDQFGWKPGEKQPCRQVAASTPNGFQAPEGHFVDHGLNWQPTCRSWCTWLYKKHVPNIGPRCLLRQVHGTFWDL